MLTPISGDSVDLVQGDRWVLELLVTDDAGRGVAELPNITVSLPGGGSSSPVAESLGRGFYRVAVTVTEPGWYVVVAELAGYGVATFRADVQDLTDPFAFMPDVADVLAYLGGADEDSTELPAIQEALNAELAAQMRAVRMPVVYPPDLAEALKRRVARNLALRGIPLAVLRGDAESGSLVPPGRDPEVRRLEAPYRKLVQP
jgi:hypothetical protein